MKNNINITHTPYHRLNGCISRIPIGTLVTTDKTPETHARSLVLFILDHITGKYRLSPSWILEETFVLKQSDKVSINHMMFLHIFLIISQDALRMCRDMPVSFRGLLDYSSSTWDVLIPKMYEIRKKDNEGFSIFFSDTLRSLAKVADTRENEVQGINKMGMFFRKLHQIYFPEEYPSTLPEPPPVITVGNYKQNMTNPGSC